MKTNFTYGFTIDKVQQIKSSDEQQIQKNHVQISQSSQNESDDLLFKIGNKKLQKQSQKKQPQILIDLQSDSDKTISVRQTKRHKKHKQQKKQKKQSRHRHKRSKYQQNLLDQSVQQEQRKKQKRIKKDKQSKKHKHKDKLSKQNNQDYKKQKELIQQQTVGKGLFESILEPNKQENLLSLLPIKQKLITLQQQYLHKLQKHHLVPSSSLKQSSSSMSYKPASEFTFLYSNQDQRFNYQSSLDFMTSAKFPTYLKSQLTYDIIRFPIKDLLQYGPMDKEIPKYQRICNFRYIIGVKDKKQKKYIHMLKDIHRKIGQKQIFQQHIKHNNNANQQRYFNYQGYQHIQAQNLTQKRQKMNYLIKLKSQNKNANKINFQNNNFNQFISFQAKDLSYLSLQNKIKQLQTAESQKIKQQNKKYTKAINEFPNNIQNWINLINLQDKIIKLTLVLVCNKQNIFIRQKKIAILQKGLSINQYNIDLGKIYFDLIIEQLQQSQQKDHQLLQKAIQSIKKFIRINTCQVFLWQKYLKLKILSQVSHSHTQLNQSFKQIILLLTQLMIKQNSSIKIKQLRKISLYLVETIIYYYLSQGYYQLALAIIVALVEFNLFVPQEVDSKYGKIKDLEHKKIQFSKYYQSYRTFRIADGSNNDTYLQGWQKWYQQQSQSPSKDSYTAQYVSTYIDKPYPISISTQETLQSWLSQQSNLSQCSWHFSNPLFNKPRIRSSIQSLVLYQDIQVFLNNYRDNQNVLILVDSLIRIIGKDLGVGKVFITNQQIHQYKGEIIITRAIQALDVMNNQNQQYKTQNNSQFSFNSSIFSQQLFQNMALQQPQLFFINFYQSCQIKKDKILKKTIYLYRLLHIIKLKLFPMLKQQKKYLQIFKLYTHILYLDQIVSCFRNGFLKIQFRNKFNNILPQNEILLNNIMQNLGWYNFQLNQLQNRNSTQQQYYSIFKYQNQKLWSIYIYFEYFKTKKQHNQSQQLNNQQQEFKNQFQLFNKIKQSISCYYQLINGNNKYLNKFNQNQTIRSVFFIKTLNTILFYQAFIISVINHHNQEQINHHNQEQINHHKQKQIKTNIKHHIVSVILIIWNSFLQKQNSDDYNIQLETEFDSFSKQLITLLHRQQNYKQNNYFCIETNPFEKLLSNNKLKQIYKYIKKIDSRQYNQLMYQKIIKWLKDNIIIEEEQIIDNKQAQFNSYNFQMHFIQQRLIKFSIKNKLNKATQRVWGIYKEITKFLANKQQVFSNGDQYLQLRLIKIFQTIIKTYLKYYLSQKTTNSNKILSAISQYEYYRQKLVYQSNIAKNQLFKEIQKLMSNKQRNNLNYVINTIQMIQKLQKFTKSKNQINNNLNQTYQTLISRYPYSKQLCMLYFKQISVHMIKFKQNQLSTHVKSIFYKSLHNGIRYVHNMKARQIFIGMLDQ